MLSLLPSTTSYHVVHLIGQYDLLQTEGDVLFSLSFLLVGTRFDQTQPCLFQESVSLQSIVFYILEYGGSILGTCWFCLVI